MQRRKITTKLKIFFVVMPPLLVPVISFAQSSIQASDSASNSAAVHIEYDPTEPIDPLNEMTYAPPVESLANNPVVAMGLSSGADAINRSVDSLLDSLFYSLLDNQRIIPMTEDSWFQLGLRREVFSTSVGTFVIFDRFRVGPEYVRELAKFHSIPIKLGIDASTEILQIYLRSDGLRVHEQEKLPFWRRAANQWFGFLPFLTAVLPPSFNQNEMYDPVKQLKTPFSFPFELKGFYEMPIGSIRSYAISGGARIFADLGVRYPREFVDVLQKIGGFSATMPYSVFVRGEHRINVLRRGENTAWVGVKNLKRTGHILSSIMSERYNLLKGALSAKIGRWNWVWQGRPVMVMPVDLNLEQAIGVSFDQVYEFDLTLAPAQKAYNAAVRGDFVPARLQYLDAKEKGIKTGVMFHFARNQKRNEFRIENGPNLAVFRDHRITSLAKSNIEITDKDGKFYVLEASQDVSDSSWDVLVGEKERRVQQSIELRVRKAIVQEQSKEKKEPNQREFYIFDTGTDPYRLSIMLTIQDRNIVASDLLGYIQRLEDISGLVMSSLPSVKVRDPVIESRFRRSRFFSSPDQMAQTLHVTPAFLGRFGAQLLMSFSGLDLDRILSRSEEDMWKAFAEAFGFEKVVWSSAAMRESWSQRFLRFTSYLVYPLRLLNMHFKSLDAERESQYLIGTLLNLKREHSPESMLDGFTQMLDTAYPEQLMTALLTLADPAKVSRRVILSTQAKGRVSEKEKEAFSRMNNMVFAGGPPMPSPSRYARAKEKLAGFYLDKPQGAQNRVQILRVDVVSVEVPTTLQFLQGGDVGAEWSPNDAGVQQRHIQMSLSVKGGSMERPLKMFLKVEEAGRLKLGKLELAEKVLEVPANVGTGQRAGVVSYDVYLTGPLSPLKGYMLDRAIEAGGKFQVTVSVSIDGIEWGDARSFEFRLENGRLMSPS